MSTPASTLDIGAILIKFAQDQGLSTLILAALFTFLTRQVWPWFTNVAYPSMITRADNEQKMMKTLTDAVLEMKILIDLMVKRTDLLLSVAAQELKDFEENDRRHQETTKQILRPSGPFDDARSQDRTGTPVDIIPAKP